MKHLTAATEELTKFEDELKKFNVWSDATGKELDRQIQAVQESDNIRRVTELHKVCYEVKHLRISFGSHKVLRGIMGFKERNMLTMNL